MGKSLKAQKAISMANNASDLKEAVIIGIDEEDGLQVFTSEVDREKMIVLLERAKLKLLNNIGQQAAKNKRR